MCTGNEFGFLLLPFTSFHVVLKFYGRNSVIVKINIGYTWRRNTQRSLLKKHGLVRKDIIWEWFTFLWSKGLFIDNPCWIGFQYLAINVYFVVKTSVRSFEKVGLPCVNWVIPVDADFRLSSCSLLLALTLFYKVTSCSTISSIFM